MKQTQRQAVIKQLNDAGEVLAALLLAIMPESANPYKTMNNWYAYPSLPDCFDWGSSPQGHDYWKRVCHRIQLMELKDNVQ